MVTPFVAELFILHHAFGTRIVKKPGLNAIDASSYRPISNLFVLPKLLQCLVVRLSLIFELAI